MTGPRNCRTRPAVVRPFQLALFTPSADCTLNVPLTAPENVTDASRLPGSGTLPPPDPDPVANWMRCCVPCVKLLMPLITANFALPSDQRLRIHACELCALVVSDDPLGTSPFLKA